MNNLKLISSCKKILFFIGWVSEITEFEADEVLKIKESALANDCFQYKSNAKIGVFWQSLIIVAALMISCLSANGQSDTLSSVRSEKDTLPYFTDMSDLLGLRLYLLRKSNNLEITNGDQTLKLNPNGLLVIGVGFNYKSIGIGIGFGIPNTAESNQKKGKTNQFDLQFSVYGKSIGIDGFLQVYKGYYNTNPNDFVDWPSDTLPQLPEMKIVSAGVSAFYIFNADKFSYKAAFVRNQIQNRSAGSVALGIFGNYDEVDSPGGFIPQEFPDSLRSHGSICFSSFIAWHLRRIHVLFCIV